VDVVQNDDIDETSNIMPMVIDNYCISTDIDEDCQVNNEDCINKPHTITESSGDDQDSSINNEDDNDEVIREFINLFDVNREQKFYSSCNLSIYNACMEIIKHSLNLNLNKLQIQHLLNGLRLLLPTENKLPRTVTSLLKIVGRH
ncbi:unnamed protein product, partial [Rotaria magnacalcarata]